MVHTRTEDETGHPIMRALVPWQIRQMSMQGITHALYTMWPDVVFFVSAFFTTAATMHLIRQRNHKIVILHTESPYQDDEQPMPGEWADLNLLNDPANLAMFREAGPAEYMPHAYRPSVHYPRTGPRNPELASDFAFIGTLFDSRREFFERLNLDGVDALFAGADWGKLPVTSHLAKYIATGAGVTEDCVENHKTAELYRNAKIGLNMYRIEGESTHKDDLAVALSPREIEMAACQLPSLRDPRPEGDEVFKGILPTFDGPQDASEKLRWWLDPAHDGLREKRAAQAREANADRTFTANAKRLLKLLEGL